jgi:hypothetical protein
MWNDIRSDALDFSALAGWGKIYNASLPSDSHDLVLNSQLFRFVGQGLQTLALVISTEFPIIGAGIGITGIWAEDVLRSRFSANTNSMFAPLPISQVFSNAHVLRPTIEGSAGQKFARNRPDIK